MGVARIATAIYETSYAKSHRRSVVVLLLPLPLAEDVLAFRRQAGKCFGLAARPADFDAVDLDRRAETEMEP